jgi:hypothetical protein
MCGDKNKSQKNKDNISTHYQNQVHEKLQKLEGKTHIKGTHKFGK